MHPEEFLNTNKKHLSRASLSYCGKGAVVGVVAWEQSSILYKHRHSFQDERKKELDVNKVPGTTQFPVKEQEYIYNQYEILHCTVSWTANAKTSHFYNCANWRSLWF